MNPLKPFRITDGGESYIFLASDLLHAKNLYDEYRALDTATPAEDFEQYDISEMSLEQTHEIQGFSLFDIVNAYNFMRTPGMISSTLGG